MGKQRCTYGASDVVVTLGPIETLANEGAPLSPQGLDIDVESAQKAFARASKNERLPTML
jgi:hypothetical protein